MGKKLPKRLDSLARSLGEGIARHEFMMMLNPSTRPAKWSWDRFVDRAEDRARHYRLGYTVRDYDNWWPVLQNVQGWSARHIAEQMMQTSEIQSWWPDTEPVGEDQP